jgi:hypothetical protein
LGDTVIFIWCRNVGKSESKNKPIHQQIRIGHLLFDGLNNGYLQFFCFFLLLAPGTSSIFCVLYENLRKPSDQGLAEIGGRFGASSSGVDSGGPVRCGLVLSTTTVHLSTASAGGKRVREPDKITISPTLLAVKEAGFLITFAPLERDVAPAITNKLTI